MESRITRVMDFLSANFELATPLRSQLMLRHGTDGQTDRQRPSSMHNAPSAPMWQDITTYGQSVLYITDELMNESKKVAASGCVCL